MKDFLLLPLRLALVLLGLVFTIAIVLVWLPLAVLDHLVLPGREK